MAGIEALGHVGIWVDDVELLQRFYCRVLGLTVSDCTDEICFLTSQPDMEHHQLVLVHRRSGAPPSGPNQVSWRMNTLNDVLTVYKALIADGARIEGTVTHGNAISVYFYDPEGNRGEAYWSTGWAMPQPYREVVNFDQPEAAVLAEVKAIIGRDRSPASP